MAAPWTDKRFGRERVRQRVWETKVSHWIRGLAFGDFVLQKLMICKLCSNRYVMCSKTVIIGNFKRFYTVTRGARRIRANPTIICGSGASDFPPKWFRSHSLSSYFLSSFLSFFPFLVLFVHFLSLRFSSCSFSYLFPPQNRERDSPPNRAEGR